MAIKKYHVSLNLFSSTWEQGTISSSTGANSSSSSEVRTVGYIPIEYNKIYSIRRDIVSGTIKLRFYAADYSYIGYGANDNNEVIAGSTASNPMASNMSFCCIKIINSNIAYMRIIDTSNNTATKYMMCEGEYTAQTMPSYEPYGDTWNEVGYKKYETATDTITSLPKTIIGDGQPISAYTIKGNMTQSGTPTPSNPVYPAETGDKTANLFDGTLIGGYFTAATFTTSGDEDVFKSIKVYLSAGTYTFSWGKNVNVVRLIIDGSYSVAGGTNISSYTITSTIDGYVGISFRDTTSGTTVWDNTTPIMLNSGSTALPYEPYGYKIPILSNGTTYPIYLSEPIRNKGTAVDSMASTGTVTRQIRKYVLTGEETVEVLSGQAPIRISGIYFRRPAYADCTWVCSHYEGVPNSASWSNYDYCMTISTQDTDNQIRIRDIDRNSGTAADFKAFLAAQYAAGTPVTIWIYAQNRTETFTAPSIPTSGTVQSFDVDTTLKPSEVSLTWHGWHEHSDEKYVGGVVNKFNYLTMADGGSGYLKSDGTITAGSSWAYTDYIPCDGTKFVLSKVGGGSAAICFYDSTKTYIYGQAYQTGGAGTLADIVCTVPQTAKFARFTYNIEGATAIDLSTIMLVEGSTAPSEYHPYYEWVEE